ncbi:MAG: DNA mismatch repair endonuclease MutL [Planctomycetota bacterium]
MIEKTKSEARIRVLDVSVANKIAAGEVVERPASVVKELVENALDAHATRLDVRLEQGGRRLVRVVDDGWGIAPQDLELAFLPHATSKLGDVADLESIATLGFRGEALASIGAVSQARILSRLQGAESGFEIENRGGEISEARAAGAAPGTDISVRNLFFNTPARARFLRTVRTELGHIEDLVRRFALAFPEVGFRLAHDGAELVRTAPEESRRDRLGSLYGRELAGQLLEVRADVGLGSVEAYLAPPSVSRPNARELHFFVNGRFVRDKILHRVVRDVYRDAMHGGRYPIVFLFLEIDPAAVDVNVHPTKAEVRWREPGFLHAAVAPALRKALRDADLAVGAEPPPPEGGHEAGVRGAMADFMRRADRMGDRDPRVYESGASERRVFEQQASGPARILQVHDSYLVCETEDGIAIVDQHALHERVQYDRIVKRLAEGGVEAQRLLVPEEVELAAEDLGVLSEHADLLARCGIAWSPFGDRSIALETLPVVIPRAKAAELVRDIVELLRARGTDLDPRTLFHDVADTMACKAAVRFGDRLSRDEAAALIEESGALQKAFVCPHGRPTVLRLTLGELEKHFGR